MRISVHKNNISCTRWYVSEAICAKIFLRGGDQALVSSRKITLAVTDAQKIWTMVLQLFTKNYRSKRFSFYVMNVVCGRICIVSWQLIWRIVVKSASFVHDGQKRSRPNYNPSTRNINDRHAYVRKLFVDQIPGVKWRTFYLTDCHMGVAPILYRFIHVVFH